MASFVFRNSFDPFMTLDRVANSLLSGLDANAVGPAYDIVRTGDDQFEIAVAVPGFAEGELSLAVEDGVLTVRGEPSAEAAQGGRTVLRRGIVKAAFARRFALAEHVEPRGAQLVNGVLTVQLVREVPEARKPRQISIGGTGQITQAA
jgi:molecular chaperone IbpA